MHNILKKIIEKKRQDLNSVKASARSFLNAIEHPHDGKIALIGEIKFASPTVKSLGDPFTLIQRAKDYEDAGIDALSIITEKHYFKGDTRFITQVKEKISMPILQKDFVVDPNQIYESAFLGADALLLIARLVDAKTLKQFVALSKQLDIEPVVEINNKEDLEKTIQTDASIIAVNARNLENFEIDIDKACELLKKIPKKFIKLGFSGIHSSKEIAKYKKAGAKGILVGTSLMKTKNISQFIKDLRNI